MNAQDKTPWQIATDNLATYIGDVNLYHGGYFIKVSDCRNYAYVIEYIDAESACGVNEVWREESTVPLDVAGKSRIKSALDCCGQSVRSPEWLVLSRLQKSVQIAYCLAVYGYSDIDSSGSETFDTGDNERLLRDANERLCRL